MARDITVRISVDNAQGVRALKTFDAGVSSSLGTVGKWSVAMAAATTVGTALGNALFRVVSTGVRAVTQAFRDSINQAQILHNTLLGLSTVAEALGVASETAQDAALRLAEDGLLRVDEAAAGLKNLLASGFGLPEAIELMKGFKDSAAFNRQASLSFGQAVVSATEGIKNQNSILVDNAGLTKNLTVIMKEAGLSVSDLAKVSSDAGVRAKFLGGLMQELSLFTGDAERLTGTYSGAVSKLSTQWDLALARIGKAVVENQDVARAINDAAERLKEFVANLDVDQIKRWVSDGLEVIQITLKEVLPLLGRLVGWVGELTSKINQSLRAWSDLKAATDGQTTAYGRLWAGAKALWEVESGSLEVKRQVAAAITKQSGATDDLQYHSTEAADALAEMDRFEANQARAAASAAAALEEQAEEAKALAEEQAKLQKAFAATATSTRIVLGLYGGMKTVIPTMTSNTAALTNSLTGLTTDGLLRTNDEWDVWIDRIATGNTLIPEAARHVDDLDKELREAAGATSILSKAWDGLLDGLTNGMGISGFFANLGAGVIEGFGNIISGGISGLIGRGLSWIGGLFSGGPSEAELAGRQTAEAFREGMRDALPPAEIQRILHGGFDNVEHAKFLRGVEMAYRDAGYAADDAAQMARQFGAELWRAEREGPEAVQAVIDAFEDEIAILGDLQQAELDLSQAVADREALIRQSLEDGAEAWQIFVDAGINAKAEVPQALQVILDAAKLANDEGMGPLIDGAIAAGDVLASLDVAGALNNKTFAQLGVGIKNTFNEAIDSGYSTEAALESLRVPLGQLILLQEEHGFKVDDGTQALIDQAREYGITGEDGKSAAQKQMEAFDDLILSLRELIDILKNDIPTAIDALDGSSATVDVKYNVRGDKIGIPGFEFGTIPQFATGTQGRYPDFGSGTLAMLHGPERIMTAGEETADQGRFDRLASEVQAMRRDQHERDRQQAARDRQLPGLLARSISAALVLAPRGAR